MTPHPRSSRCIGVRWNRSGTRHGLAPLPLREGRFTSILELHVDVLPPLPGPLLLDVVEIEERLHHVEVPFRLARLDLHDLAGALALDRVRPEGADNAYGVQIIREPGRKLLRVEDLLNLVVEVLLLHLGLLDEEVLKATTTESRAGFPAVWEHRAGFDEIVSNRLRNSNRDRLTCHGSRPNHPLGLELRRECSLLDLAARHATRAPLVELPRDDDLAVAVGAVCLSKLPNAVGIAPEVDPSPLALERNSAVGADHLCFGTKLDRHAGQPTMRTPSGSTDLLIAYQVRAENSRAGEVLRRVVPAWFHTMNPLGPRSRGEIARKRPSFPPSDWGQDGERGRL